MEALSLLPLKGNNCLTVTHLQFEVGSSRTRRRRRRGQRVFDKPFSQFLFVSLKEPQCGVFSNQSKLNNFGFLCEPKRNSFGASFALALALEKEAIGNSEDGFSKKSDCISMDEVKGGEKIVIKEKKEKFVRGRRGSADKNNSTRIDLRAVVMSLQSAKTADDVEEVVKDLGEVPLPACSTMIKRFGVDRNLDPAMAMVEWLKRKKEEGSSIGPNLFIYNSLLGAVKLAGKSGDAEKIMKEMNEVGVVPNIVTYNILMAVNLEQGEPTKALNVLEEVQKKGISPSAVTYSIALAAYRSMEDGDGALKFFVEVRDKYQKGEIKNDDYDEDWDVEIAKLENFIKRICYQVMRRWLVKGDQLTTQVLRLLMDMDNADVKPSQEEQERLVWACTLEGHYIVAKELYTRIREQSQISLSTCNHVIWLMGKAKKWWAALEVYEDLLDIGPKPNNLSQELIISHFNILLTAAQKKGIWRWGVRLLNKMEERGLKPGSREWNAVLVACSKASETTAAVQIFERMVENGKKPDIISYGALLSALEKGGLYDEALQVWEHMAKVGIKPNLYAYTILASVHSGQGKSEMVESVIQEMVKAEVEPTVVTFNAIISGYARNGMGSTAFEWYNRMKERDLTPNSITYEMLINALTRDAKPRLAYEMYLKAQSEELKLSSKAYDDVIRSASVYGATIDERSLGPRPLEKKNQLKTRKNLKEFCDLAEVPRRSKPFEKHELQSPGPVPRTNKPFEKPELQSPGPVPRTNKPFEKPELQSPGIQGNGL